jgi:hypothetical protein
MLSSDYNRKISKEIKDINEAFIRHSRKTDTEPHIMEAKNKGEEREKMLRKGIQPLYDSNVVGSGIVSDFASFFGLGKNEAPNVATAHMRRGLGKKTKKGKGEELVKDLVLDIEGGKKHRRRRKGKGTDLEGNGFLSSALDAIGLGQEETTDDLEGRGVISSLASALGLGKGDLKGGMSIRDQLTLSKKDKELRSILKDIKSGKIGPTVVKSTVGGKKKKSSKWIEHVKKYAKKHNIKYSEALSKARSSYKA